MPYFSLSLDQHRVPAFLPCQFTFLHEPMGAVRLNYHARFTAEEGSPEWQYVRWKDAIRDLFDQFDCRDHTIGVPFTEPLSVSGRFLVSENFDAKDLDNLVKGILDAMNPVRKKNFKDLRTFLWVDDRCIKRFGTWESVPSKEPRIEIEVMPLWGRIDPMVNYIEGDAVEEGDGRYRIDTRVKYPFTCFVPAGVAQPCGPCRVWVLPVSAPDGCYTVVAEPAQVIFFRELAKLPRVTEEAALQLLRVPWDDVREGLVTGDAQRWAQGSVKASWADRALGQLRELFVDPEKRMIALAEKFDQTAFETVASEVSQRVGTSWATVRRSLVSIDLDWRASLEAVVAEATKAIEVTHGTARRAERQQRTKKPNAARPGQRAAH